MASSVTVPVWVAVAVAGLAVVALIDRLFGPALRWWMRRRANRAIDELNQRLSLKIPPFKLARRGQLIEQLMFDPDVLKAVEDEAKTRDEPRSVAYARAKRYAREIVPAFSAYAYFRVGTALARRISTALYRVRLGATDEAALIESKGRLSTGQTVDADTEWLALDGGTVTAVSDGSKALFSSTGTGTFRVVGKGKGWGRGGSGGGPTSASRSTAAARNWALYRRA